MRGAWVATARPATAEERERLQQYPEQIEREFPQLRERAQHVE